MKDLYLLRPEECDTMQAVAHLFHDLELWKISNNNNAFSDSDRTCGLIFMGHTWSIHFNTGWSQRRQMWERSQLKEVITRRDLSVCERCQSPVGQASLIRVQAAMTRVKCDEWPRKYQLLQQNPVTLVKLFLVEVSWDSFFTPSWQQIMSDVFSTEMKKYLLLAVRHVPDYL